MQRAIGLARKGQGWVEPNPMVGCVIVRDGVCIAEGYHRRFGQAHAEVDALRSLTDIAMAKDATAYVTLEPCCHTGKTPPCTEALISAGVARVVVAMRDPFPKVDGGGISRLEQAGIRVDIGTCCEDAEELNAPYLKLIHTSRPWTIAKWAMSIDGRIATATGDSQWISGELSRGEVHRLRGRVDAIIVGGGTAMADNPTLTARPPGPRTAMRIVFAGRRLPSLDSNLVRTLDQAPLMIVAGANTDAFGLRQLEACGVEVLEVAAASDLPERVEMVNRLLDELGRRRFTNVMIEGGGELIASFVEADQLDEIHAYVCPKLIGGRSSPGPVGGMGFSTISQAIELRCVDSTRFDDDQRLILRRAPRRP
jgi:diaminohydroxyphosphoribosylaminopyrimidine deaminase/5-amino-6-(5-phosphoribosylamino)uracil reductase